MACSSLQYYDQAGKAVLSARNMVSRLRHGDLYWKMLPSWLFAVRMIVHAMCSLPLTCNAATFSHVALGALPL